MAVHVLVLEAFSGKRPENHVAHHKDGNTENNSITNLCWVTPSENVRCAYIEGNLDQRGSNNNSSKLNEYEVIVIRRLLATRVFTHEEIGRIFDVARSTISQINTGLNWGRMVGIDYAA